MAFTFGTRTAPVGVSSAISHHIRHLCDLHLCDFLQVVHGREREQLVTSQVNAYKNANKIAYKKCV